MPSDKDNWPRYLTPQRYNNLLDLIEQVNSVEVRGFEPVRNPAPLLSRAQSGWNEFQKVTAELRREIKRPRGWQPSRNEEKEIQNLVNAFNDKRASLHLRQTLLRYEDIARPATSSEGLQQLMNYYREFLKPGGEDVVGMTPTGLPVYRWQQNVVNKALPRVNEMRRKERENSFFSYEGGSMGTTEFWEVAPKENPLVSRMPFDMIGRDINVIIRQSTPAYWNQRAETYKSNLLRAVMNITDPELRDEFFEFISQSPARVLAQMYSLDITASITHMYRPGDAGANSFDQRAAETLAAMARAKTYIYEQERNARHESEGSNSLQ